MAACKPNDNDPLSASLEADRTLLRSAQETQTNKQYIYCVLERLRSEELKKLLIENKKEVDLCIYDMQDLIYASTNLEDARKVMSEQIASFKNDKQSDYWKIKSIYLVKCELGKRILEGLVNEEMIEAWNPKLDEIVPKGVKKYTGADGKESFYYVM
jgi:hypothetical protein